MPFISLKNQLLLFVACLGFVCINHNHFFIFDNIVQIAIPANFYYDNNFTPYFLPNNLATGHPTFVAYYVALIWKVFGRSLWITHLAFLPFVYGFCYQLLHFIKKLGLGKLYTGIIFITVLFDVTLLCQLSIITFDVVQLFFFLWCINSIINHKKWFLAIAFTCLILTSMRGTICAGGVLLFDILYHFTSLNKPNLKRYLFYLPGILCAFTFYLCFYLDKHWIVHNTVSNNWANAGEIASPKKFATNIASFAWQLINYGRLATYIVFVYVLYKMVKTKTWFSKPFKTIALVAFAQFLVFFPLVIYKSLLAPKYLLPIIIFVTIATLYWIFTHAKQPKLLYVFVLICTLAGYVNPSKHQSWDATPAHWPYYSLRNLMMVYIVEKQIPFNSIGSFFPNLQSIKNTDLANKDLRFVEVDSLKNQYIFYSNMYNEAPPYQHLLFNSGKWIIEKELNSGRVQVILFRKK